MRELALTTSTDQPDIEIGGEVSSDTEIAERMHETHTDFVAIALDNPARHPPICDTVLRQHPGDAHQRPGARSGLSSF
jgi:AmiR/NasT family two-component response regulator